MVLISLPFIVGGGYWLVRDRLMRCDASGVVINAEMTVDGEVVPVVTFRTADGMVARFADNQPVGWFGPKIGEGVPVRYNARDPTKARVATVRRSFFNSATFLFVTGVALAVAGLLG